MQNEVLVEGAKVDQKIFISSRYNASATLSLADGTSQVYNITPTKSEKIPIPMYYMNSSPGEVIKKNILIKSDKSISVTGYSSQLMSSDMFAVIPTSRWGYEYQAITMGIDHYSTTDNPSNDPVLAAPRSGEFMIIANEDNTVVKFTPKKNTKTHPAGVEVMVILNKWESYLVQAEATQTKTANDLSGSVIRSNRKIGVLSGHMRTAIPPKLEDRVYDTKDHIVEMLNSSEYFGKEYVSAPFGEGIKSLFAVTTLKEKADIDILTDKGVEKVSLPYPGAVKYIRVDEAAKWSSDSSFQLGQFMARYEEDQDTCNEFYDPAFVIIQPLDYFNNNLNFLTPGYNESGYSHYDRQTLCGGDHKNRQYIAHHAIIIAKDEARQNTMVDGILYQVSNFTGTIPGTDYYYGYVQLEPGEHKIETPVGGFQGILYGNGYYDSYAYSLGSAIINNKLNDTIPLQINEATDCDTYVATINDNDEYKSGIQYVDINQSSYNIEVIENEVSNSIAKLRIKQKDKRKDAFVSIDYFDNAGNGMNTTHSFKGINPVVNDIDLGKVLYNPNDEFFFNIINESNQDIKINNIKFDSNKLVLAESFVNFYLPAKDTVQIGFYMSSVGAENIPILNYIYVESECNVIDTAEVKIEALEYGMSGEGYDFGDILLGDTECGKIYFENTNIIPLTITNLEYKQEHISLDTLGLFPVTLKKGEKIEINTCSTPLDRNNVNLNVSAITWINGFNIEGSNPPPKELKYTVQIKENIIGAIFNNIEYDFGNVYKGFESKTNLELENIGNFYGVPVFQSLKVLNDTMSQNNQVVSENLISSSTFHIGDKNSFEFAFEPQKSGVYSNTLTFAYQEGVIDESFDIILKGNALISEFTPYDNCFDTIYTSKSDNKNFKLFSYLGDVSRNIYLIRPNKLYYSEIGSSVLDEIDLGENPFELINFSYSKTFNSGEAIISDVSFTPTKAGYYKLDLILITNSLEVGKALDTIYSTICGVGITPLLPNVDLTLNIDDLWACDTSQVHFTLTNTGETEIIVNKVNLENPVDSKLLFNNSILPYNLKMNDILDIPVEVFLRRQETSTLKFNIEATDLNGDFSTTFTKELDLTPKAKQLILPQLSFNSSINDTTTINIFGDIPYDIDIPAKMTIEMEVDYEVLWLISEAAELVITYSSGQTKKIPINVSKNLNKIIFDIPYFEFDVIGGTRWSLSINFWTMMSDKYKSNILVNVKSEECFEENSAIYELNVDEVCAQNVRIINSFDFGSIKTDFVYLKNDLNVNINIPVSSNISIYLIDMLGKKLDLSKKMFANKGNYFLNYDLNFVPNGKYILVVETKFIKEIKNIIIIK